MDIKAIPGAIQSSSADAIIVNLFEGAQPGGATGAVDQALNGAIREIIEGGDFTGKLGEAAVLYPRGAIPARRVILTGLGSREIFNSDIARRAAAHAIQKARDLKIARVASILHGAGAGNLSTETAAQAVTEGSLLALYQYRGQKTDPTPEALPKTLELIIFDEEEVIAAERGIRDGMAVAAGVRLARDLVNLPPNICTPAYLGDTATELGKTSGLRVEVLEKAQLESLKMGALLAVAQGSETPPRFVILEHNPERAEEGHTVVLIGKGVTFDTGGYSIKTAESMSTMKGDMAGAAAVIGAMGAIAGLKLPLHVVGLIPAADNMISGRSYRPQEVITASNGTTIEIISTDAEGRLLLADALVFAAKYKPSAVVDIATLTGACFTALGGVAAGLFSLDEKLRDTLLAAGDSTTERVWPMPLYPEYKKPLESLTADIKNSTDKPGGVGTSATFLKQFITYPAWAHLDMAGMGFDGKDNPYVPSKGATGYGVRLLTEFVRRWVALQQTTPEPQPDAPSAEDKPIEAP
jgi:leucyl aminopeptidase